MGPVRFRPFRLATAALALLLAACGSGSTAQSGDLATPPAHDPTGMDYIALKKGPCFGACPVFDITLRGDGRVEFYGRRFTKVSGQKLDQQSTGRFLEALDILEERGFGALQGDYTGQTCTVMASDHPTITIEVNSGDWKKTVVWNTGCRGSDDIVTLERLVRDLDWTLDVDSYVGTDAEHAPTSGKGRKSF
ncbi:MAG: hypothetical protein EP335_17375 [Alphaproteobacteria bacterium]|nr:MAG: hypothetical protein EP335_17375 [Alphaproteobacteria bacterium]